MITDLKKQYLLMYTLMFLLSAPVVSCGQKDIYEGRYIALEANGSKTVASKLELSEKGQAVWRTSGEAVSFRWDIKGDELWLSTDSGGIIIGKINGDSIEISLPGGKEFIFTKK